LHDQQLPQAEYELEQVHKSKMTGFKAGLSSFALRAHIVVSPVAPEQMVMGKSLPARLASISGI